jgi:hypothetical protein
MKWTQVLIDARRYLTSDNVTASPIQLPACYDFSRRVMFHIRQSGYEAAVSLVQADADRFTSYGLTRCVLCGLALLQGVRIT